ncbi:hypothetical protein [Zavarzinella formosa]|uniref:hypothetical protein n=1 Tax=Zavarzinella formosa TaxID=360055 RepID=UPI0002DF714A|nr:hypothetical protein [Zavarzinella formosa]
MSNPSSGWVITEKATGKAIAETFLCHVAEAVNTEKYQAVPITEYLQGLNRKIKGAA